MTQKPKIELSAALICEAATVDRQNRAILYGIFNQINAQEVPTTHPQFAIFCVWEGTVGGKHEQGIKIVAPSGKAIVSPPPMPFEMTGSHARLISQFNLMRFEEFGTYRIEISLDGETVKELPLDVIKIEPRKES